MEAPKLRKAWGKGWVQWQSWNNGRYFWIGRPILLHHGEVHGQSKSKFDIVSSNSRQESHRHAVSYVISGLRVGEVPGPQNRKNLQPDLGCCCSLCGGWSRSSRNQWSAKNRLFNSNLLLVNINSRRIPFHRVLWVRIRIRVFFGGLRSDWLILDTLGKLDSRRHPLARLLSRTSLSFWNYRVCSLATITQIGMHSVSSWVFHGGCCCCFFFLLLVRTWEILSSRLFGKQGTEFLLDLFFELGDFVSSRAVSSVLLFTFVRFWNLQVKQFSFGFS